MTDLPGEVPDPLPDLAQRCWGALELIHVVGYFAPETAAAYRDLGLRGWSGYFSSRSAAMGPVEGEVTLATFYVFAPRLVLRALPSAWRTASPPVVLGARHEGVSEALHRVLDPVLDAGALDEAVALARQASESLTAPGRPLYAAHARLPWPSDPLLALWHAATLMREHRGDGHVATLLSADLDPVESMLLHGLTVGGMEFLVTTRGWGEQDWAQARARLTERGLLDGEGELTEAGRTLKGDVEARTQRAAEVGWRGLGVEGSARLLELIRPWARTLRDSDLFPAGSPVKPRG